jgi:ureidoacrylate peracid hydrolase
VNAPILRSLAERVDPAHTALVLVDFQVDFCAPEGYYGRKGTDLTAAIHAVRASIPVLEGARAAGVTVVFVKADYDEAYQSGPMREILERRQSPKLCVAGTPGADFYLVAPRPGEYVVTKHRYSAFTGTNLDQILQANGVQCLVVVGVTTVICVETTVRDAFLHDYYAVVLSDCVAARSKTAHEASLGAMASFGQIVDSAEVLEVWKGRPAS